MKLLFVCLLEINSVYMNLKKLQKELKSLQKKYARSELQRANLEEMRDHNSQLFETYYKEIEEQRKLIKEQNIKLEIINRKLSKYLSPQLYNSIFKGEREVRIETSRKILTVFFSDVVRFTKKAEVMSPNDLTYWLNRYLDKMAEIALKYKATIDKFMGDSILIFFGDPISKGIKEDACDCIHMALEMRKVAADLDVNIRMGIATGECTVGNFGSENRMDYTVIGTTVNAASRLEKNSENGQILISKDTYELVKDNIQCRKKGKVFLRGMDREIFAYWVVKAHDQFEKPNKMNLKYKKTK